MVTAEKKTDVRAYSQGAVVVLEVRGPLCRESLPALSEVLQREAATGVPRIVIDLSGVTLVDSAGLEWLLDEQEKARERGGDLRLARATDLFADVLRVTGLHASFEVYDSIPRAVGSYAV